MPRRFVPGQNATSALLGTAEGSPSVPATSTRPAALSPSTRSPRVRVLDADLPAQNASPIPGGRAPPSVRDCTAVDIAAEGLQAATTSPSTRNPLVRVLDRGRAAPTPPPPAGGRALPFDPPFPAVRVRDCATIDIAARRLQTAVQGRDLLRCLPLVSGKLGAGRKGACPAELGVVCMYVCMYAVYVSARYVYLYISYMRKRLKIKSVSVRRQAPCRPHGAKKYKNTHACMYKAPALC